MRWFFLPVVFDDVIVATAFTILAGGLGLVFLLVAVWAVPRLMNALTPKIDEEKEIARGNMAVAHYFGAIVQAMIIGMSIIIAAAIIAGIHG